MTPRFFRYSVVLIVLSVLPIQTYATSRRSAEEIRVANLAVFIQSFADKHNGRLPTSWEELNANASLSGLGNPAIQDRYILASNAPISVELNGAQIVAMGRTPFSDDVQDGTGRFVVFRTKDDQYQSAWVLEDKIQKIIADAHLTVPPQIVPQPAIPPRPPLPPVTKEQYEILKRSGLLAPHQEITIVDAAHVPSLQPSPAQGTSPPSSDGTSTFTTLPKSPVSPIPTMSSAQPVKDTGIRWWIYGPIVISVVAIVGAGYYLWSRKKQ